MDYIIADLFIILVFIAGGCFYPRISSYLNAAKK